MKKINFILILVLISNFYSCNNDDDNTEIKTSTENGFTFNSEFFTTDELFLSGTPGELFFFIIDDTSGFNTVTRTFEGDPGQLIAIVVPFVEETENPVDFVRTFTNAVQDNEDETTGVSFVAALYKDVLSIEGSIGGNASNETISLANTGEVTVSFDAETSVFTLDYTFTTNDGTITGFHKGEFIIFE